MTEQVFFQNGIYFQTSFEINNDISFDMINKGLIEASNTKFDILLYHLDSERTKCQQRKDIPIYFHTIEASSLMDAHNKVINNITKENTYMIQFYKYSTSENKNYLIINAHHALYDGNTITCLVMYLYDFVNKSHYNDEFIKNTTYYNPFCDLKNLRIPISWNCENHKLISPKPVFTTSDHDIDYSIVPEIQQHIDTKEMINLDCIVDSTIFQRCLTNTQSAIHTLSSCKHGLLLYICLKALYNLQETKHSVMKENSYIGISSVINMRRYLQSFMPNPSICIHSFSFQVPIQSLCNGDVTPEYLQRLSNSKLEESKPLFDLLQKENMVNESAHIHECKTNNKQINFEISFLGIHPKYCFQRSQITQFIQCPIINLNTISCVFWINPDNSLHICISALESSCSKEYLNEILQTIKYDFYDFSTI